MALVRALAWPVTVVLLVLLFRAEIKKLMSRLSEHKYRDVAARFSAELDIAEENAASTDLLTAKRPKPKPESEKTYGELSELVDRLASESPRAAALEAWRHLELAAETAAGKLGMKLRQYGLAAEHGGKRNLRRFNQMKRIAAQAKAEQFYAGQHQWMLGAIEHLRGFRHALFKARLV